MHYYIEVFHKQDETLDGYLKINIAPDRVAQVFGAHPVGCFELCPATAKQLKLSQLDFENNDYVLTAVREYVDETYEYEGEKLHPPPMFLPDHFGADPVRPKTPDDE